MESLGIGKVEVPDWSGIVQGRSSIPFRKIAAEKGHRAAFMMFDINYVRTEVRKRIKGDAVKEAELFDVEVEWEAGGSAVWTFDRSVGWPIENGEVRDWKTEWIENFRGTA